LAFGRMPNPGARTFCAKIMRRLPFYGPGGQPKCGMPIAECGMEREAKNSEFHIPNSELGNARSARRILRKSIEVSRKRASPADAFCTEAPCPRATTQASRKGQTLTVPRQSRGFTLRKLLNFRREKDLRNLVRPQEGQEKGRSRTLLGSLEDYSRRIAYDSTREVLITLPG
jgi:hypothetical protein